MQKGKTLAELEKQINQTSQGDVAKAKETKQEAEIGEKKVEEAQEVIH